MIINDETLNEIIQRIASFCSPEKIILFGSYAYGAQTSESDLDIMVIMETLSPPHKRAVSLRKLLRDISVPKDIIVKTPDEFKRYKDVIGTIVYPAAHYGRIVYERK
ncbi:nucleotidyltransferase domain-containing protein [Candidatus Magnetomonas plexicatena]|uniref:nucleotidyltransferase domain-containing protein n=1 Tax=Candidatus Magnetomonas plexicatena TaxID=2552947 RepID=UPI00110519F6|nr:nucleotidyltransferase domain-containing protein [Nitrospirales bacterium LBB_01]